MASNAFRTRLRLFKAFLRVVSIKKLIWHIAAYFCQWFLLVMARKKQLSALGQARKPNLISLKVLPRRDFQGAWECGAKSKRRRRRPSVGNTKNRKNRKHRKHRKNRKNWKNRKGSLGGPGRAIRKPRRTRERFRSLRAPPSCFKVPWSS